MSPHSEGAAWINNEAATNAESSPVMLDCLLELETGLNSRLASCSGECPSQRHRHQPSLFCLFHSSFVLSTLFLPTELLHDRVCSISVPYSVGGGSWVQMSARKPFHPGTLSSFPEFLQVSAGIVLQVRPRPHPPTSFPVIHKPSYPSVLYILMSWQHR